MGIKTGKIIYNVSDRGRKFRGQDRNFDSAVLANLINSGDVQERVKNRDLFGFYGHWPRVKFGMNPLEGAIVDGKAVALEPALVTTYLKAMPDGTIEHEAEFLDTGPGKLAARLYTSKAGGFSSAIDTRRAGDKLIAQGFSGFDYVLEPNYNTNRGYTLDAVDSETILILDEVAEYNASFDAINHVFDSLQADFMRQKETLEHLAQENADLMAMLAKSGEKRTPVLDGIAPDLVGGGDSIIARADEFKHMDLPGYEPLEQEKAPPRKEDPATAEFMARRGYI